MCIDFPTHSDSLGAEKWPAGAVALALILLGALQQPAKAFRHKSVKILDMELVK
jgi:hypothetical protein